MRRSTCKEIVFERLLLIVEQGGLTKKNLAKDTARTMGGGGPETAKSPEAPTKGGTDMSANPPERGEGRKPPTKPKPPPVRKGTTAPMTIGGPKKKKPPPGSLANTGASI